MPAIMTECRHGGNLPGKDCPDCKRLARRRKSPERIAAANRRRRHVWRVNGYIGSITMLQKQLQGMAECVDADGLKLLDDLRAQLSDLKTALRLHNFKQ